VSEVAGAGVELERPKDPSHGDFATNVAMRSAKSLGRNPRELAQELAERVVALDEVVSAEVAGPGFLNLRVADSFFLEALGEIDEGYGGGWVADAPERVQVEMVSANPTGPLHVAHGRNGAYGDSVARLLEYAGHDVQREYYYNDSGTQMERFRASVDAVRRGEEPPEDGYRGEYIHDLAALRGDPVPSMLAQIEQTLERFPEMRAVVEFGKAVVAAGFAEPVMRIFQLAQRAAQFHSAHFHLVLQLVARFPHDALVLVAQRRVPVAQRDGKQQHFQCRAYLHAVLGDEVLRHEIEGDGREHTGAQQEQKPRQQK
jgi:arginyl-tRNA synthetase